MQYGDEEVWATVPDCNGYYEVSNHGWQNYTRISLELPRGVAIEVTSNSLRTHLR